MVPPTFIWGGGLKLSGSGGSMGKSPVEDWGQSTPDTQAVYRHCLQILSEKNDKNWKILHNSRPDS